MKQILIVEPGSISEDQKKLFGEHVLIIEHTNPEKVRVITPMDGFEGNDLIQSFIEALESSNTFDQAKFAKSLMKKIKK